MPRLRRAELTSSAPRFQDLLRRMNFPPYSRLSFQSQRAEVDLHLAELRKVAAGNGVARAYKKAERELRGR